ncbi:MAG: hypothetical protein AVDCRST_MAG58-3503 [uncultured Rubrobacteraceae bacterium]|uniref:Uncharacterized protein n=1 Tax=uncultured Rubrobacteraceae bacterium TaxID=349277 RepID=A0A6J4RAW1_9ACTN|nr:MAG: hypothetical protein AVDCRST_MAG58-3503 [uncultured Rubrobacteraceae bacterium]
MPMVVTIYEPRFDGVLARFLRLRYVQKLLLFRL